MKVSEKQSNIYGLTLLIQKSYVPQKNSSYYEQISCIYCREKHKKSAVNLLLLSSLRFLPFLLDCSSDYCLRTGPFKTFSMFFLRDSNRFSSNCSLYRLKTIKSFSTKLKLRMKCIFLILIIRYNFEISEDDHPYSLSQMLTLNFAHANA